jgi:leucyl/phenylalanyl-tRNA--protein transferase
MQAAYRKLHELGFAHSVEAWNGDQLVGGLYGVALGKFFFGESMFHLETNASKVILAQLSRYLQRAGFVLLDCQVPNPHLVSMGREKSALRSDGR